MTSELLELVDNVGKLLPHIREELIKNFCESTDDEHWCLEWCMPVMSFSLTKLIDEILKKKILK